MRAVIQRTINASVYVKDKNIAEIDKGLLIFLGIEIDDTSEDVKWLASKIALMRIFSDINGKMNKSIIDIDGSILLVSQFTLHAKTRKGNRPSFVRSARPEKAINLYEEFKKEISYKIGKNIKFGEFGTDMKVSLTNDGPVTIIIDSKIKE